MTIVPVILSRSEGSVTQSDGITLGTPSRQPGYLTNGEDLRRGGHPFAPLRLTTDAGSPITHYSKPVAGHAAPALTASR